MALWRPSISRTNDGRVGQHTNVITDSNHSHELYVFIHVTDNLLMLASVTELDMGHFFTRLDPPDPLHVDLLGRRIDGCIDPTRVRLTLERLSWPGRMAITGDIFFFRIIM